MTIIEINTRFYTFPTSYNELSRRQLLRLTRILYSSMNIARANLVILKTLSGINAIRFMLASVIELADYFYLAEYFYVQNDLTKNLLPVYRGRYGPADDFDNLTGAEFTFTEMHYHQYIEGRDPRDLDKLAGMLYRRPKAGYDKHTNPDGDVREPFNKNLVEHYGRQVKHWPLHIKQAILTWYTGCRLSLERNNPKIFGGEGSELPQYGMWSIMRSVAEKGNHGSFDKIEVMLIKEIMMELNEIVAEADRLKNFKPNE